MKMRVTRPVLPVAALLAGATFSAVFLSTANAQPQGGASDTTKKSGLAENTGPVNLNDERYGEIDFGTHVGSFKLLGSDPTLAQGKLEFSFKGTVLVGDMDKDSKLTLGGDVRKEYETEDHRKAVYFGTGTMTIVGRVRAVQFFGQNLSGHFLGWGIFSFYGEFDKSLDTGWYQLKGGPKTPLGTGGMTVPVPNSQVGGTQGKVKIKKAGG